MTADAADAEQWSLLAASQAGAICRRQLRSLSVSRSVVRAHLRGRRWQRVHPGTYVVFSGPLTTRTKIWAAILYAGEAAVASHATAAWLHGFVDESPARLDVCVPHGHRYRSSRSGVRVRQSRYVARRRHPAQDPPRTRLEDTVLDMTDEMTVASDVFGLLLLVCQRRLTTAGRLRDAMTQRSRMRWRVISKAVLADVLDGVQTPLERAYWHNVEKPHGLPTSERTVLSESCGRRRYRDVRYEEWRVLVELDGRAAHPEQWQERDDLRDNQALTEGREVTLRYGWQSVCGERGSARGPCAIAS